MEPVLWSHFDPQENIDQVLLTSTNATVRNSIHSSSGSKQPAVRIAQLTVPVALKKMHRSTPACSSSLSYAWAGKQLINNQVVFVPAIEKQERRFA